MCLVWDAKEKNIYAEYSAAWDAFKTCANLNNAWKESCDSLGEKYKRRFYFLIKDKITAFKLENIKY